MKPSIFRSTLNQLWLIMALLIILFAFYVAAGRQFIPALSEYRERIEATLSAQLGMPVTIAELNGIWTGFEPILDLRGFELSSDMSSETRRVMSVDRVSLHFDTLRSLTRFQLVFRLVSLSGVTIELAQTDGRWHMLGLPPGQGSANVELLANWILAQQLGEISESEIRFQPENGQPFQVRNIDLKIRKSGSRHRFEGSLDVESEQRGASFRIAADADGDPFDREDFFADIYMAFTDARIDDGFRIEGLDFARLDRLRASGEAWAYWRNGRLDYMLGAIQLPEMVWSSEAKAIVLPFQDARADFAWRSGESGDWSVELTGIDYAWGENRSVIDSLRLRREFGLDQYRISVDRLSLQPIAKLLLASGKLSEKLQKLLEDMQPSGDLENVQVQYRIDPAAAQRFVARTNFRDVSIGPWGQVPTISGFDGYAELDPHQGYADFQVAEGSLGFPRLFTGAWPLTVANGRIGWRIEPEQIAIQSGLISLTMPDADLRARFSLDLPRDRSRRPDLELRLGVLEADGSRIGQFLPARILKPGAVDWLKSAVRQGQVRQGAYLYHGDLKGELRSQTSSLMFFDVEDARFSFHADWEEVSADFARVIGRPDEILVDVPSGGFMGAALRNVDVQLPTTGDPANRNVTVQGEAEVSVPGALNLLRQSPLKKVTPEVMGTWTGDGRVTADLMIKVPLGRSDVPEVDLRAKLHEAALTIPQEKRALEFREISGDLGYSNRKKLHAKRIVARFLGQRAVASIRSLSNAQTGGETRIRIDSRATAAALREFTGLPVFGLMEGRLKYDASLRLFGAQRSHELVVNSDLSGLSIDAPRPLGKAADAPLPFRYQMRFGRGDDRMSFEAGELLRGKLVQRAGKIRRGLVRLGSEPITEIPERGIRVDGKLSFLDFSEWTSFKPRLDQAFAQDAGEGGVAELISSVDLGFDELLLFGRKVPNSRAVVRRKPDHWQVDLKNEVIHVEGKAPHVRTQPYDLHVHYLRIPKFPEGGEGGDPLADVDPSKLPVLIMRIDELRYGDMDLGNWDLQSTQVADGIRFENVNGEFRNMRIQKSQLEWRLTDGMHRTDLDLSIGAGDIADVLEAWNFTPTLDSKEAAARAELTWPHSPGLIRLPDISGTISAKIEQGRFIELQSGAGALRVFGVLNVDTISRRLRLDFSDLFKKGLSYDQIKGQYQLESGVLKSVDTLDIEGPSTNFHLRGNIDLINETMDQKLVVVLPVTSNLPLAALLTGNPALAGAIYLTEKLFGDKLERLASAQYRVRGAWNDPEVKLIKMFSKKD